LYCRFDDGLGNEILRIIRTKSKGKKGRGENDCVTIIAFLKGLSYERDVENVDEN
jgi:hypothetical protein